MFNIYTRNDPTLVMAENSIKMNQKANTSVSSTASNACQPETSNTGGSISMKKETQPDAEASFDSSDTEELAARLKGLFDIRDRKYGFPSQIYEKCFVGNEAVKKLIKEGIAGNKKDAVQVGVGAPRSPWTYPTAAPCQRSLRPGSCRRASKPRRGLRRLRS